MKSSKDRNDGSSSQPSDIFQQLKLINGQPLFDEKDVDSIKNPHKDSQERLNFVLGLLDKINQQRQNLDSETGLTAIEAVNRFFFSFNVDQKNKEIFLNHGEAVVKNIITVRGEEEKDENGITIQAEKEGDPEERADIPEGYDPDNKFPLLYRLVRQAVEADASAEQKQDAKNQIQALLDDGVSIDTNYRNQSVTGRFASEGNEAAVALLVNEYHANVRFAILGFFRAGRGDLAQIYRKKIEDSIYFNLALTGTIERKDDRAVDILFAEGGKTVALARAVVYWAMMHNQEELALRYVKEEPEAAINLLQGSALCVQNPDLFKKYFLQNKENPRKAEDYEIEIVANLAAIAGNDAAAELLRNAYPDKIEIFYGLIQGAAQAGEFKRVERYIALALENKAITKQSKEKVPQCFYKFAARGAAFGGHKAKMIEYVEKANQKQSKEIEKHLGEVLTRFAAQKGHYALFQWLINNGVFANFSLKVIATEARIDLLEWLVEIKQYQFLPEDIAIMVKEASFKGFLKFVLYCIDKLGALWADVVLEAVRGERYALVAECLRKNPASISMVADALINSKEFVGNSFKQKKFLACLQNETLVSQLVATEPSLRQVAEEAIAISKIIQEHGCSYKEALSHRDGGKPLQPEEKQEEQIEGFGIGIGEVAPDEDQDELDPGYNQEEADQDQLGPGYDSAAYVRLGFFGKLDDPEIAMMSPIVESIKQLRQTIASLPRDNLCRDSLISSCREMFLTLQQSKSETIKQQALRLSQEWQDELDSDKQLRS